VASAYTRANFEEDFPHNDECLHRVFQNKYGRINKCPSCDKEFKYHKLTGRKVYSCQFCGNHISPLVGTIFEGTRVPLKDWFYAIFLFSCSKNGVSAMELQRHLGVTYQTAWRMAKQIRLLFQDVAGLLDTTVEVDETYIGGRRKGTRGRGADHKTPVIGLVQRGGNVKAKVTPNVKSATVQPLIRKHVKVGTTLMTDEYGIYNRIERFGYQRKVVNHGTGQYVKGMIYTNTIEGFWSQLKRSIDGTHHSVSPKYLQSYVNEHTFKYNQRDKDGSIFHLLLSRII
jgi:transposase